MFWAHGCVACPASGAGSVGACADGHSRSSCLMSDAVPKTLQLGEHKSGKVTPTLIILSLIQGQFTARAWSPQQGTERDASSACVKLDVSPSSAPRRA